MKQLLHKMLDNFNIILYVKFITQWLGERHEFKKKQKSSIYI